MADGVPIAQLGNYIEECANQLRQGIEGSRQYFLIKVDGRIVMRFEKVNVIFEENAIARLNNDQTNAVIVTRVTQPTHEVTVKNDESTQDPVTTTRDENSIAQPVTSTNSQTQTTSTDGENVTQVTREYEGED